jgi:NADPH:quinone reductase-like Zn-dependent oxidoreductase
MKGSMAEYCAPPLNQIARKPATLTHCQAAALPLVGTTCVQAFEEHGLRAGQRVLIIGASGGVGHV